MNTTRVFALAKTRPEHPVRVMNGSDRRAARSRFGGATAVTLGAHVRAYICPAGTVAVNRSCERSGGRDGETGRRRRGRHGARCAARERKRSADR